jgi:hypothetical protein
MALCDGHHDFSYPWIICLLISGKPNAFEAREVFNRMEHGDNSQKKAPFHIVQSVLQAFRPSSGRIGKMGPCRAEVTSSP